MMVRALELFVEMTQKAVNDETDREKKDTYDKILAVLSEILRDVLRLIKQRDRLEEQLLRT
jgi:hypothetical protein